MSKLISSILLSMLILIPLSAQQQTLPIEVAVAQDISKQVLCMAKNLYYEAAMEPFEGKLAVAQVTMNRTRNPQFPHTVCGVVYEKDQFSWVAEKHKGITDKYAWEECVMIAKRALTEHKLHDTIYKTKSMYFHNTSVHPEWKFKYVAKIGNHLFYTRV